MAKRKIKTLLIEDSGFMRILLTDILRKDESIEIIDTARNGLDGVEKALNLKPDVVITDMVMPQYDGLYVVQELMRAMPLPIILLSSLDRTNPKIFDALKEGAFDFLDKPMQTHALNGYLPLTDMVKEASISDYLKLRKINQGRNTEIHSFEARLNYDIIAIGASTGGPSAVEYIVSNLPKNLSIPVIIAQHMPERFIESFSQRLAQSTGLKLSVLADNEPILNHHIYLAPGTSNVRVVLKGSSPVAQFVNTEYKEFNNPSIDCLFESIANIYGRRAVGVILTGMGRDGTIGLKNMNDLGSLTIVQDAESAVVYGMPRSALESGAAQFQIPLSDIPSFIISAL